MNNTEKLDKILSILQNEFDIKDLSKDNTTKADNTDVELRIRDMERVIEHLSNKIHELEKKNYHLTIQVEILKMNKCVDESNKLLERKISTVDGEKYLLIERS